AFNTRQEDAAKTVADGRTETALERLHNEPAERLGARLFVDDNLCGQFKTAPSNMHENTPDSAVPENRNPRVNGGETNPAERSAAPTVPRGYEIHCCATKRQ